MYKKAGIHKQLSMSDHSLESAGTSLVYPPWVTGNKETYFTYPLWARVGLKFLRRGQRLHTLLHRLIGLR